jgi:hypothetical protein
MASAPPSGPRARVDEPFGQVGVRQFFRPGLTLLSVLLACGSAYMWYRSYELSDAFVRSSGTETWWVRSIYGRIVITGSDFSNYYRPVRETGWNYICLLVGPTSDGWDPSLKKVLGVQWRNEPLFIPDRAATGWWVRIRWRTIVLLFLIGPAISAYRKYRRDAPRGFEIAPAAQEAAPGASAAVAQTSREIHSARS